MEELVEGKREEELLWVRKRQYTNIAVGSIKSVSRCSAKQTLMSSQLRDPAPHDGGYIRHLVSSPITMPISLGLNHLTQRPCSLAF